MTTLVADVLWALEVVALVVVIIAAAVLSAAGLAVFSAALA